MASFLKWIGNFFGGLALIIGGFGLTVSGSILNMNWAVVVGLIIVLCGAYFLRNSFRH